MGRSRLALVIPAFNEAATVGPVVRGAALHGTVVVVDDASNDRTGALAQQAGADVVRHGQNRGYDGALESGFRRAAELGCEFVVTLDADGQHNTELIAHFAAALERGADLVLGVRDRRQRFAEHIFAWFTRARFGIHDPLCGMKGYRLALYKALGHFDSYGSIGTELALFAVRNGARFAQIPVATRPRADAPRFDWLLRANQRILRSLLLGCFVRRDAAR